MEPNGKRDDLPRSGDWPYRVDPAPARPCRVDRDHGTDRGPVVGGGWRGEVLGTLGLDRTGSPAAGHRGVGPIGYRRTDERIREDACEALTRDDRVDASQIEVGVADGEITLAGHVPDRRTKRLAERCVEDVSGVKDVHNRLIIRADAAPADAARADARRAE